MVMIFGKKATVNNVALSMQKNKIKKTQKNIESIQQIDQKDIITRIKINTKSTIKDHTIKNFHQKNK